MFQNYNKIFDSVIKKVSLDKKEISSVTKTSKELIKKLKKIGLNAKIGGSLAKQTLIKKPNQDVDLFVEFNSNQELEKNFEKKVLKLKEEKEKIHGSRDYFKIVLDDIAFEIIPVIKLKKNERAENITDFSLIHVDYIKRKIAKNKKLPNEIKLAKAFCYAQNCYGAESYINGFSGYAIEVLISYHGSFLKFLKNSKYETIDSEKLFKSTKEISLELNSNKLQSPIILIDPTYKYRNVCAGLSKETFDLFLDSAKKFLKNPSEEFFSKKEFDLEEFLQNAKEEELEVYEISIKTDRQEGDIAGTKMKKFSRFIIKALEEKEQKIKSHQFVYTSGQEAKAYLAIERKEKIKIIGPKKDMLEAIKNFVKVRKNTFQEGGFICAEEIVNIEDIFEKEKEKTPGMGIEFSYRKL